LIKLFEMARQAIDQGLATRTVNTSYAGELDVIRHKRAFVDFEQYARERGIEVLLSVMSTAGGINVGPGSFALSYIAGPPIAIPMATAMLPPTRPTRLIRSAMMDDLIGLDDLIARSR
jgi:hypothetical protein